MSMWFSLFLIFYFIATVPLSTTKDQNFNLRKGKRVLQTTQNEPGYLDEKQINELTASNKEYKLRKNRKYRKLQTEWNVLPSISQFDFSMTTNQSDPIPITSPDNPPTQPQQPITIQQQQQTPIQQPPQEPVENIKSAADINWEVNNEVMINNQYRGGSGSLVINNEGSLISNNSQNTIVPPPPPPVPPTPVPTPPPPPPAPVPVPSPPVVTPPKVTPQPPPPVPVKPPSPPVTPTIIPPMQPQTPPSPAPVIPPPSQPQSPPVTPTPPPSTPAPAPSPSPSPPPTQPPTQTPAPSPSPTPVPQPKSPFSPPSKKPPPSQPPTPPVKPVVDSSTPPVAVISNAKSTTNLMIVLYTVLPALAFIIGVIVMYMYCKNRNNQVKDGMELSESSQGTNATVIGPNEQGVSKEQIMKSEFQLPDENQNSQKQLQEFYSQMIIESHRSTPPNVSKPLYSVRGSNHVRIRPETNHLRDQSSTLRIEQTNLPYQLNEL